MSLQIFYAPLYIIVVMGGFFGISFWRLRRRPTRRPLGEDIRLRRQPGEHLRGQVNEAWENLFLGALGWLMLLPAAVFVVAVKALPYLEHSFPQEWLLGVLVVPPLASLVFGGSRLYAHLGKIVNLRLGLFGERAVADQLEGLMRRGYEVFHDVPCVGGGGPFNLDHVVVGRGVVVVVETKTRRKPKGDKDGHKLNYNGQALVWPGGATSTRELEQAQRQAEWLHRELEKEAGVKAKVHPVLTFPGWFVNGSPPQAPGVVTAHKALPNVIEKRFPPRLTEQQTEAVIRHLNRLCTHLTYADLE